MDYLLTAKYAKYANETKTVFHLSRISRGSRLNDLLRGGGIILRLLTSSPLNSISFRRRRVAGTVGGGNEAEQNRHDKRQPGVEQKTVRADGGFARAVGKDFGDGRHEQVAERHGEQPETHDDAFQFQRGFAEGELQPGRGNQKHHHEFLAA